MTNDKQVFLSNKYTKIYYLITDKAKRRTPNTGEYYEKHHIIPKCLGGSNDSTNIVKLTAREHFICHKLLIKMTEGKNKSKMSFAYNCFFIKNQQHPGRNNLRFSSREYEYRKKIISVEMSKLHKNKIVSEDTKAKSREIKRNNKHIYTKEQLLTKSKNSKRIWSENHDEYYNKIFTAKTRDKMRRAKLGKKQSQEQIRKRSLRMKGDKNPRATKIKIISPKGDEYHCYGNFYEFCKDKNLPFSSMCLILYQNRVFKYGKTVGWKIELEQGDEKSK